MRRARIDKDLPNMKRRAQAWAVGDVATLRARLRSAGYTVEEPQ